jgi:hypothetical protein
MSLTPDEMATKMDGEALLRKLAGANAPSVVGPDGLPMKDPNAPPVEPQKVLSEDEAKALARKNIDDHVAKLREANARERDEALTKMKAVCEENKVAKRCMQVMLHAHRLIAWAKLEMQTLDQRVDDKALMHLERQVHGTVYNSGGGGFTSQSLAAEVRKNVCEFIEERNRVYADFMRRRKVKIAKTVKRFKKTGFSLPCKHLEGERDKKLQGMFGPGSVVVLYGSQKAISASLKVCGITHATEDHGKVHHFVGDDVAPAPYCEDVTMVVSSWWRNALQTICKFYDTLSPVVDSPSTMLLIDDLNSMLLAPDTQMSVAERKSRILSALRQWAVEHFAVVVVGDPVDLAVARSAHYGGLVCAPVRIEKKDDVASLVIGEDAIDVKDLRLEA